ncbi:MAG: cupin domain-containing protein [Anaerolineales bacterium]|nr:cupin domain-containing protein [Anaerolineales bacterium]
MPGRKAHFRGGRAVRNRGRWAARFETGDSAQAPQIEIGDSLRALREQRNLTIRALAEISGLNVNTLSLIENGKSSPSVNTLQQIALALEVPVVAFFEYGQTRNNIVHLKRGNRPKATFSHGRIEDLGSGMQACPFEAMIVEINPQTGSGDAPIVHTGYELVFCLEGRVDYQVEGRSLALEPGDSLFFEAHLPHRWDNRTFEPSRMILVLCPADENDRPLERHFILSDEVV